MRTYYPLRYRLDDVQAAIIWYSNDTDGVLVDACGSVPAFRDPMSLAAFTATLGIEIQPYDLAGLHDLDTVQQWLGAPERGIRDPAALLMSWNLFLDVAASVADQTYLEAYARADAVYEKLSWEALCASIVPTPPMQEPTLVPDDVATLREVLGAGLLRFRESVRWRD